MAAAVRLVIGDVTLRDALTCILEQAGYAVTGIGGLVVTDQPGATGETLIHALIVEPVPAACQRALDAITTGRARSAVLVDQPEQLPAALAQVQAGIVTCPDQLVAKADQGHTQTLRLLRPCNTSPTTTTPPLGEQLPLTSRR